MLELLWIVAGVAYIVFKLIREEFGFSWSKLWQYTLTVLPIIIGGIAISVSIKHDFYFGVFFGVVFVIAGIFIALMYSASCDNRAAHKNKLQTIDGADVQRKFQNNGYPSIDIEMINNLINDPYSPLNHSNVSNIPYGTCYRWMCDKGTWEIDKLSREDIGNKLGVPLDEIPLDQTMKLGDASLKRTTLAKNRLLSNQGLLYRKFPHYLDKSDEYYIIFNHFVDEYISEHQ